MSTEPKVLVCTLLCDRKAHSQHQALPAIYQLNYSNYDVYINIETKEPVGTTDKWAYLDSLRQENSGRKTIIDQWFISGSDWWNSPTFDQDQARLFPICIARNMARDCALHNHYDYIFFVDADVIPEPDSLTKLMSHSKMLISGEVPGRGAHKSAKYIFHVKGMYPDNLLRTLHATCGYTLIKRDLFAMLPFRAGPSPVPDAEGIIHFLSEDPAYGADAIYVHKKEYLNTELDRAGFPKDALCDGWWVDTSVKAKHEDDPVNDFSSGAQF